jgi:hypothetical protein
MVKKPVKLAPKKCSTTNTTPLRWASLRLLVHAITKSGLSADLRKQDADQRRQILQRILKIKFAILLVMQQNKIIMWVVISATLLVLIVSGIGYSLTRTKTLDLATETQRNQQNSPTTDNVKNTPHRTFRNEAFGFELHYPYSVIATVVPLFNKIVVGPPTIVNKTSFPDIFDNLSFSYATSSYLSLDELQADLQKRGNASILSSVGNLPVLILEQNGKENGKTICFLKNEFEYCVSVMPTTKTYLAENFISDLTFFTKHSQEEVVAIIKEDQESKSYNNDAWGFSFIYPTSYKLRMFDSSKNNFRLWLENFFSYGGDGHIDITIETNTIPTYFDGWEKDLPEDTIEERINELTVSSYKEDSGGASYAFLTKDNRLFTLHDNNAFVGTSRIKDILSHMTFFTPKN